ncbi:MAG: hypothetical protein GWP91_24540 [Rhodobacterales bacterium]|nr:hypothetical protein [Rhodobacterales bacterium]
MRIALILVPLLLACGGKDDTDITVPGPTTIPSSTTPTGTTVVSEIVGTPSWSVRGMTVFSGPLDASTTDCVVGDNHFIQLGVYGPGDAHAGPYDTEVENGVSACGYAIGNQFLPEDFSNGNGIWLGVVLVPNPGAVAGNSPDFDSGDVIQWDRFPMLIDGDLRRGPFTIADGDLDVTFPGPDDFGFTVNGHSHVVLFFGTAVERFPAGATPPGEYAFHLALRDATSDVSDAGWNVMVPFVVADLE